MIILDHKTKKVFANLVFMCEMLQMVKSLLNRKQVFYYSGFGFSPFRWLNATLPRIFLNTNRLFRLFIYSKD